MRGGSPDKVAAAVATVDGIHGSVAPALASWHSAGTSLVEAFPIPDGSSPTGATS